MPERLSYFVTAVVGILGWLITYYVDRISQTPTVEYTIRETDSRHGLEAVFILSNVNRTQAYGPLTVTLLARPKSPIRNVRVRPIEPAEESRNPVKKTPGSANFSIPKLMPGGSIRFDVQVSGHERPDLRLDAEVAVRFTERSFDTWLARNEMGVVVGLIVMWAAILVGLVAFSTVDVRKPRRRRALRKPKAG